MSVFIKAKPAGVDITIQSAQKYLYAELNKTWGTGDSTLDAYGRIYRNQSNDGYIPEAYDGKSEYKEVFFDDLKSGLFFFLLGEKQEYNGGLFTPVAIIFEVNIPLIKPGYAWRADEEIRTDVELLCHGNRLKGLGFTLKGVETGIDSVFREFSGWRKEKGIKYGDEHPYHCFRLNFNLLYTISNC